MNSLSLEEDADIEWIRTEYLQHGLTHEVIRRFQGLIVASYKEQGRVLPWRQTADPYRITVSEFMLQQTRVERVQEYYLRFIRRFPGFPVLASATLREVLEEWKGLGYNRRALALRETARIVRDRYGGFLPADEEILLTFPGIGKATAAAIRAFAFEQPSLLLETNIRTVFLYFFFPDQNRVHDRDILPLLEKTIHFPVRDWYYALMDFGVRLKKTVGSLNHQMHTPRTPVRFAGSDRQMRGRILSLLMTRPQGNEELGEALGIHPGRLEFLLHSLEREGFLTHAGDTWSLTR